MTLRHDFFKKPMLRVTQNYALNDPFEADPQSNQIESVFEIFSDYGECYDSGNPDLLISELQRLRNSIKNYGVVSFTEDYTNLLMWSHYANEHRGMVVEFLNYIPWLKYESDMRCEFSVVKPERVTYRFNRPEFDKYDVIDCDWESNLLGGFYLTKSNDWIYEKEHRTVLPLYCSDKIIVNSHREISELVNETFGMSIRSINDTKCEIKIDKNCSQDDRRFVCEIITAIDNGSIFLCSVNELSVTCIYLGCKVTDYEASLVLGAISENGKFPKDILVKRAILSTERYSLDFETISYPMLHRI